MRNDMSKPKQIALTIGLVFNLLMIAFGLSGQDFLTVMTCGMAAYICWSVAQEL